MANEAGSEQGTKAARDEGASPDRLVARDLRSGDPEADQAFTRGVERQRRGELEGAIQSYGEALARDGRMAEALANMALALRSKGNRAAARAALMRAYSLAPDDTLILGNLGNLLRDLGELELSLTLLHRVMELAPTSPQAQRNLGLVLRDLGHLDEARLCFEKALKLEPKLLAAEWDLVLTRLVGGDYARGFPGLETRWRLVDRPRPHATIPAWDGRALNGRSILLFNEQGIGDAIQFARFAPLLKARGAGRVVLECDPSLLNLFRSLAGVDMLATKGAEVPGCDLSASLLSLPGLLGLDQTTLPQRVPYLSIPPGTGPRLTPSAGARLSIGLVWAGSPKNKNDRNRSAGFAPFLKLLSRAGIAFYSLQKGKAAAEPLELGGSGLITDLSGALDDFAETGAAIQQLDLIISVDTAVAHLAGALGRPCWLLLPFVPDWRWGVGRDDSPWYPHLHLFRQPRPGDWDSVFETVGMGLDTILHGEA